MPHRKIQARYEQLSEFERGPIIGLREGGWANWRIAGHMGRSDAAIRRCCDESRFHLCPDDHRRRVWRRPGQCADHAFTIARPNRPSTRSYGLGCHFSFKPDPFGRHSSHTYSASQDNAKPHTTRVAMNCLIAYQTLPWPARSPDPSLIEHVRDMMGRRLHLPGNVDDLARQLE
ncbi:transposable element Tc1 transposase [Trichonephila clavipes]|nr:transposable element Tc1 transposase [Trichonephila clavipes]